MAKEQTNAAAPSEEAPAKSRKEAFRERMKSSRPDLDPEDEESFYGAIGEDYDNFDKERERYSANEKRMTDLFNKDGRSADFVSAWANGKDPVVELVRQYGDEFVEALNDPDKQEALAEANKKRSEHRAKSEEMDRQWSENDPVSREELAKAGISEEDFRSFCSFIADTVDDMLIGKYSPEAVKTVLNGMKYDTSLEAAREEGRLNGRNEKIEATRQSRRRGDGVPQGLGGGGGSEFEEKPKEERPDIGALAAFGNRDSWAGAKRIKR